MKFLHEHELMQTMGWTRQQLEMHSPLELQGHFAVLEYKAAKAHKAQLEAQHQASLAAKR